MSRAVLVVLTQPDPEREDEFNEWYDDIHLPEVLAVPGINAATRYRVSDVQVRGMDPSHRYLSIYEVDGDDPRQLLRTLFGAADGMAMSDAMDLTTARAFIYEEITPRRTADGS